MNRIIEYIKNNKTGVSVLVTAIILMLGLVAASGCRVADIVKVNVPQQVCESTGVKPVITLSKATHVRQQFIDDFTVALTEFDENIEGASAFHDLATSLLNTGMVAGQGALAGVPGGAFLLSFLTGIGGLYLKKPGTDIEMAQAKQASFNSGQRKARALLAEAAVAAVAEATNVAETTNE